jgi:hypothetical protein
MQWCSRDDEKMNGWHLDIDSWPGPNRKKWKGLRDIIEESPDGKYVAVLYSCGEVGINKEVGFFALLEEPKDSPRLLLRPRGLTCLVSYAAGRDIQWIEDRFCVVTSYSLRPCFSSSGHLKQFYGAIIFDVKERKVAYVPGASSSEVVSALPDKLSWKSWRRLSWWPRLWLKR